MCVIHRELSRQNSAFLSLFFSLKNSLKLLQTFQSHAPDGRAQRNTWWLTCYWCVCVSVQQTPIVCPKYSFEGTGKCSKIPQFRCAQRRSPGYIYFWHPLQSLLTHTSHRFQREILLIHTDTFNRDTFSGDTLNTVTLCFYKCSIFCSSIPAYWLEISTLVTSFW